MLDERLDSLLEQGIGTAADLGREISHLRGEAFVEYRIGSEGEGRRSLLQGTKSLCYHVIAVRGNIILGDPGETPLMHHARQDAGRGLRQRSCQQ